MPVPRTRLRFAGRSFLALVLDPSRPVADWFVDLDALAEHSPGFFVDRPVVLQLSRLSPDRSETKAVLKALAARDIRVVAVEGVDPGWVPRILRPIAGGIALSKPIDPLEAEDPQRRPDAIAAGGNASAVIDTPVRSGQSIFFSHGDLTVVGSVSSGAEVIAAGSIHVEGALRGRAIAGATGKPNARIFCRRFEAELVAIDGRYLTADECDASIVGKPAQVQLNNEALIVSVLD